MTERTYLAIDLKSFYASVECMERSLDPMTTNLVVADASRTEKTICLAVSPSLKAYGIPGRARLFEVVQKVKEANLKRQRNAPGYRFTGASLSSVELANNPGLAIDYLIAPPRMAHYMEHSTRIYSVYLKHVAPDDIHVYSIDEVLIDATSYLKRENITAKDLAMRIILDVLRTTGITATAGIGPNLYLAKIAMDIYAKHVQPDENGVRIAELDEMKYRQLMWTHRPLTDFWRVGKGYEKKLESISHTGVERPMFSPNFIGEPVDEAATLSNLVGLLGVRSVGSVNRLSTLCGVTGRSALIALARRCTTLQFV